MRIKTNITEEREVEIKLPMFKKEKIVFEGQSQNYFAVLPDETAIDIFISGPMVILKHWTAEKLSHDVINRLKWDDITEEEFLSAHARLLKSLSLEPQLCEIDQEIEAELNKDDLKGINI